ncbi:endonuclease [Oceanihabitans sediminis]|uniref:endonuclease n=1 Tax=Oceanihabitans sediminis TaxID=1812012 RepID=UPI00299EE709|nr:endonuclease [Oceanihabitans sediminis]MDX1278335.1 endonuclease [Oceanihabitans sediminis]
MKNTLLNFLLFIFSLSLYAQVPAYYSEIDFSQDSDNLKQQLSILITNTHTTLLPYTSSYTDTWDVLKQSDIEIINSDNIYLVYGYNDRDTDVSNDKLRDKSLSCHSNSCYGLWNREHVFPKSLANPRLDTSYPSAGTDAHNLRPADSQMNSSRSNRVFALGSENSNITPQGHFFPGEEWKGDIARIIMYMYLRYPPQCKPNDVAYSTNNYHTDMPDIFLEWNVEDPVSEFETHRNNTIASYQGNRNPFIDNPYLATLIWGGTAAIDSWETLSVEEKVNNKEKISVYPNPTSSTLNLKNNSNSDIETKIYTIDCKLIETKRSNNKIDVSKLESGLYFLNIKQDNQTQTIPFIKN